MEQQVRIIKNIERHNFWKNYLLSNFFVINELRFLGQIFLVRKR